VKAQTPPAFGRAYQRTEHQFKNRLLAEAIRDNLQPPALLDEETFEQIGCARRAAMRNGQPKMRDAGLEVIVEAGDRGRQRGGVIGADAIGELTRESPVTVPDSKLSHAP
jgi:hypothetical protein